MKPEHHIPCTNKNMNCKYYPNCHESDHHIYPRKLGRAVMESANVSLGYKKLVHKFITSPTNVVRVCRCIHDTLDQIAPRELPSTKIMKDIMSRRII